MRPMDPRGARLSAWFRALEEATSAFLAENDQRHKPAPGRPALPPISADGLGFEHALKVAVEALTRHGVAPTRPGFFAYVPGGSVPAAAFGDFIAALTNRSGALASNGPGAVSMDNQILEWMVRVIGLPPETAWGALVSGSSIGAAMAFAAARERLGGVDRERAVVYLSDQGHASIPRALRFIGMGDARVRTLPATAEQRLDPELLAAHIAADRRAGHHPWLIVATAGTTSTGAVDPIADVARVARAHAVWLHVDGAYGGLFALADVPALDGIGGADSLTVDVHKTLSIPHGTGAVLLREGRHLREAFGYGDTPYLDGTFGVELHSPAHYGPELTRHNRAVRLWLALHAHGTAPFRAILERCLELARSAHRVLAADPRLVTAGPPDLSTIAFRHVDGDDATARLMAGLNDPEREFHVSGTRLHGRRYIRVCILSFRTDEGHVTRLLEDIDALL